MRWMCRSRDWVPKPLVRVISSCADWGSKELMSTFCSKDPSYSTQPGNVSFQVTIPDTTMGPYTFVAAVPHLVGVRYTSRND